MARKCRNFYFIPIYNVSTDRAYIAGYQALPKENDKTRRERLAITKIQRACHKWLYAPECKDGTVGIVPRLEYQKVKNLYIFE